MGRVFKPGPCSQCGEPLVKGRCNRGVCQRCATRIYRETHPRSHLCETCGEEHDRRLRCPTAPGLIECSECGVMHEPYVKGLCPACYMRAYLLEHPGANQQWVKKHPEEAAAYQRARYLAQRDTPEYQRYIQAYQREYAQTPHGRENIRNNVIRRRARKHELPATLTVTDWQDCLADWNSLCAYCGRNGPMEREHFIPQELSGGATRDNILPACRRCNRSKGTKHPKDWCSPLLYDHLVRYLNQFHITPEADGSSCFNQTETILDTDSTV